MTGRAEQSGVVLVTILVVVALCVTVIVAMTAFSMQSTEATFDDLQAEQARALVTAGEASAVSALLRDLENPPEADGPSEAWARLAQDDIAIAHGRFSMQIRDEAALFNLNTLTLTSPWSRRVLDAIVATAGLKPEVAARVAAALAGGKPLLRVDDLVTRAGLSKTEVTALEPFVTCTPDLNGGVNVNTAPEALLGVFLKDPDIVANLVKERTQRLISTAVLEQLGIALPEGLTVGSNVFGLTIAASSGPATVMSVSTIHRWRDLAGTAHAVISQRQLAP